MAGGDLLEVAGDGVYIYILYSCVFLQYIM